MTGEPVRLRLGQRRVGRDQPDGGARRPPPLTRKATCSGADPRGPAASRRIRLPLERRRPEMRPLADQRRAQRVHRDDGRHHVPAFRDRARRAEAALHGRRRRPRAGPHGAQREPAGNGRARRRVAEFPRAAPGPTPCSRRSAGRTGSPAARSAPARRRRRTRGPPRATQPARRPPHRARRPSRPTIRSRPLAAPSSPGRAARCPVRPARRRAPRPRRWPAGRTGSSSRPSRAQDQSRARP